jgi:AcrR family transcriptional regulator
MLNPTELETRERILAAAHTVFLRQGTAKARTQEIADEAGVNKALIHYYFGTKDALADEVFAAAQAQLWPQIFRIFGDPARSIEDKVREVVDFEIGFLAAHPYLPGYVAAELHTNPERMTARMTRSGPPPLALLQQQLDAGFADGRYRQLDAPQFFSALLAAIVFPFIMRPALEKIILRPGDTFEHYLDERRRTLADFFLAGLRP